MIYAWGNQQPNKNLANFDFLYNDTMPVTDSSSGQSSYGLYHMAGNVWKWINDYYDEELRNSKVGFRCAKDAP